MTRVIAHSDTPRDHLIIPDDHAYPGDNFRRFEWLGNYILQHQPEVIVTIGDRWEMASLCSYDKGKKGFVFKNVKDDIEAGHQAESLIFGPMLQYNSMRLKNGKKQYKPIIVKCIGNHEFRVKRLLELEPRWEGSVSMESFNTRLNIEETVIDYLDFKILDGVCYSHLFVSGVQGRPFSSARAMVNKKGMSCTMGHTHTLDHATLTKPTGDLIRGLVCGSYHDPDHAGFAGAQVDSIWWNGLIHKHGVINGDYDLEEVSIRRMAEQYS